MSQLESYKILVRERHVDSLGHMNNATYLEIYEEARWEVITGRGFGFYEIQKRRQGPVVLDVQLRFLKEIGLREEITVTTELLDYAGKVGHLKQQMIKADGTIASDAVFTFGLFDLKERRLTVPTPEWKKAVGLE